MPDREPDRSLRQPLPRGLLCVWSSSGDLITRQRRSQGHHPQQDGKHDQPCVRRTGPAITSRPLGPSSPDRQDAHRERPALALLVLREGRVPRATEPEAAAQDVGVREEVEVVPEDLVRQLFPTALNGELVAVERCPRVPSTCSVSSSLTRFSAGSPVLPTSSRSSTRKRLMVSRIEPPPEASRRQGRHQRSELKVAALSISFQLMRFPKAFSPNSASVVAPDSFSHDPWSPYR